MKESGIASATNRIVQILIRWATDRLMCSDAIRNIAYAIATLLLSVVPVRRPLYRLPSIGCYFPLRKSSEMEYGCSKSVVVLRNRNPIRFEHILYKSRERRYKIKWFQIET